MWCSLDLVYISSGQRVRGLVDHGHIAIPKQGNTHKKTGRATVHVHIYNWGQMGGDQPTLMEPTHAQEEDANFMQ